jgi:hypothetical protein
MSFRSIQTPLRVSGILLAMALGLASAACGGGVGHDPTGVSSAFPAAHPLSVSSAQEAGVVQAAAASGYVNVAGCVLDRHYIPTTGTPVRALAADGRLLGSAQSDSHGRFTLRLPAHSDVWLQIDRPSGESLPMRVDAAARAWETCLLDEQA